MKLYHQAMGKKCDYFWISCYLEAGEKSTDCCYQMNCN